MPTPMPSIALNLDAVPTVLPLDERLAAALTGESFDETDTEHVLAAIMDVVRAHAYEEYERGLAAGDYFARQGVAHKLGLGELRG